MLTIRKCKPRSFRSKAAGICACYRNSSASGCCSPTACIVPSQEQPLESDAAKLNMPENMRLKSDSDPAEAASLATVGLLIGQVNNLIERYSLV